MTEDFTDSVPKMHALRLDQQERFFETGPSPEKETKSIIRCGIQQVAYFYNKKQQLLRSSVCFMPPLCEHTLASMFDEVENVTVYHIDRTKIYYTLGVALTQ